MIFSLFAREDEKSLSTKNKIQELITKKGGVFDDEKPDYVIFVGGDGTFLRAVHRYIDILDKVRFVGINLGTLGFFCHYQEKDIELLVEDLFNEAFKEEEIHLLQATLKNGRKNKIIKAVNEIRIENPFHTLIADVEIENTFLENYRGNGLVVSSALGSTAYNKSLGGAVVVPSLNILQLTEIAAIENNAYRCLGSSLILQGNSTITFKGHFNNIVVGYDYLVSQIDDYTSIEVTSAKEKIKLLRNQEYSYIKTLNTSFIK